MNRKGKRKAGEKIEWSADEDDDAYEKFKNRAAVKRKKIAQTKKKIKTRANDIVGKKVKGLVEKSTTRKEKVWGDDSEYELMEDSLPDYLQTRRKKFEKGRERLKEAGLRLPPEYDDIEFSDDGRLAELEERPNFSDSVRVSRKYEDIHLPHSLGIIPASIAQYLRDYQIDGVAFLHELFVYQKGGILGDDMGLGKTVQVAAFLATAFGKTGDERDAKRMRKMRRAEHAPWYPKALVVCPGSLIENWKQELNRWGWWHVDAFHGDSKESVLSAAMSGRLEIVITTYQTYKMYRSKLNLIEWDCVVADECHQLKERTSETTKAMNEVNSLCRIGLTGTAIQNKYEELWTLLHWTNPGRK
jgi:DNA excision repair protein ERCC-6-like 2